jgi:hypothetical protein
LWSILPFTALILAACGGSTTSNVQTVRGEGYTFDAPAGWTVSHKPGLSIATQGPTALVEVQQFTLEKPYRVARFAAVSRELDGDASTLARQSSGKLVSRATRQIAGRKTRYYSIDYGPGKRYEIAFVLDGLREYQLLCRRVSSASDSPCSQLFSSFSLG